MNKNIPAFPQTDIVDGEGMTLRDYFAAKAMAALLGGWVNHDVALDIEGALSAAEEAYLAADAMLQTREK